MYIIKKTQKREKKQEQRYTAVEIPGVVSKRAKDE